MERRGMKTVLRLVYALSLFQSIRGSAIISIELLNYTNPRGANAFGSKCDLFPGGPELPCDPSFHLCVSPRPVAGRSCIWTNVWRNKNTVQFKPGMNIAFGKNNPLLYEFQGNWKGKISLNVMARDEDGLFDDQLDIFKTTINIDEKAATKEITMYGEMSSLSIRVKSLCSSREKEANCKATCTPKLNEQLRWDCKEAKKCIAHNDETGHYECDKITGKKKCLPGWADESNNCKNDIRFEVSCSVNYMRIDIDRNYFNPAKYAHINLLDPSCKASITESHISLDTTPQLCGSRRVEADDYIIYENEVNLKAIPTDALITREHDVRIRFKCSYNRSDMTSLNAFLPLTSIDVQPDAGFLFTRPNEQTFSFGKKGYGAFKFNIQMYKDRTYKTMQNKFPFPVKLNQSIYFEVNSTSNDNDLVLLIDRCYATPKLSPNHRLKHVFIENGCPRDKTVNLFQGDRKRQRFGFNTFAFIRKSRNVYVHCTVLMCRKSSKETKCVEGCNGDVLSRAKRDTAFTANRKGRSYTKYYLLNIGPIERDFQPSKKGHFELDGDATDQPAKSSVVTVVLIVAISLLGLVAVGMLVKMIRAKVSQNHQSMKEIGTAQLET